MFNKIASFGKFGAGALIVAATATVSYAAAAAEAAANFPGGKPVHIIVSTGAGSGTDLTSRQIAQGLSQAWGSPVVVENRTGASGAIGAAAVARAAPDGYTLLGSYAQHYANQLVQDNPTYDAMKDFEPVARIANSALVISVPANSPYKTLQDLIDAAKKSPGTISYGSSGNGTTSHMAATLLEEMAGIKLNHIPYRSPGQVALDAASGQLDISFNGTSSVVPFIQAGRLRPLAVTTATRTKSLPDTPTVAESGYAGYDVGSPIWIFAPAGTPKPIIDKLSKDVVAAAMTPEFAQVCANLGLDVDVQDAATVKAGEKEFFENLRKMIEVSKAASSS